MEDRYARHHLLEGWDQHRLANARVLVAGVGAVGNEVVKLLALMGVGHLLLVDFDTIEMSNLTRSVLFRESDIGQSKARIAALRASDLNPDIAVHWIQGHLDFEVGLGVYWAQDVVIGCLDSLNARLALNRACYRAGVPWINTGIEATVAEIALFQSKPMQSELLPNTPLQSASPTNIQTGLAETDTIKRETGACFECGMSAEMWERRNQRFSCGGLRDDLPPDVVPTTATVASLAAAYAVNEALLLLHGRKEGKGKREEGKEDASSSPYPFSLIPFPSGLGFGQKLFLSVAPYGLQTVDLPRSLDCLAHEVWEPVTVIAQCAAQLTAAQLLRQEGMTEGVVELGFDLLTRMRCLECGEEEEMLKPLETCPLALNQCPHCHTPSRQPETLDWLAVDSPLADRPLADLGIPEHQILGIKSETGRRYVQISGDYGAEGADHERS